jgi:hypothetical protein
MIDTERLAETPARLITMSLKERACPFFPFWRAAAFCVDWRMLLSRPSFSPIYVESYVKSLLVLARARQTPRVPFLMAIAR